MKRIRKVIKWLLLLFFGSSITAVVALKWIPVYITPLMVIRAVNPPKDDSSFKSWHHHWVPLDEISPWLPKAVVATEDQNFYSHNGFDFQSIRLALKERKEGKRERGASTISQQTAKNVFLWPGHSWVRKGLEAYFTALIELIWGKERIMEVYLNSIEMGRGIYGAEAAATQLFHTQALKLTRRQCALIAVSLPNPVKRNPANPSAYMNRRANTIMKWM